jgi:perosamine synthetase
VGAEELQAISDVFASGILTNGPATAAFEAAFAARHGVAHGVAFATGTLALSAIYLGVGIGPGDEVIVPSLTFISSATSVLHVGAQPVFAEVRPDTYNLDPSDVARRITPRTRAILAVHYGGQPSDLDKLTILAAEAGVLLLEDAAEAHGASWMGRPVGGVGAAGMFSFTGTKNMTTGEGGMVTTDDYELAERLRLLRNHGQTSLYHHDTLGWNWRMTEMQAAMGCVQLDRLTGIIERKRQNAIWMAGRLAEVVGLDLPPVAAEADPVYMLYTLRIHHGRDRVLHALHAEGIEARLYFPPVHLQPIFAGRRACLPVTEALADELLSIPFHALLGPPELEAMAKVIEGVLGKR